jgi:hypothetical protein
MDAKILNFPYKDRPNTKAYIIETIKSALDNKTLGFMDFVDIWLHFIKGMKK